MSRPSHAVVKRPSPEPSSTALILWPLPSLRSSLYLCEDEWSTAGRIDIRREHVCIHAYTHTHTPYIHSSTPSTTPVACGSMRHRRTGQSGRVGWLQPTSDLPRAGARGRGIILRADTGLPAQLRAHHPRWHAGTLPAACQQIACCKSVVRRHRLRHGHDICTLLLTEARRELVRRSITSSGTTKPAEYTGARSALACGVRRARAKTRAMFAAGWQPCCWHMLPLDQHGGHGRCIMRHAK